MINEQLVLKHLEPFCKPGQHQAPDLPQSAVQEGDRPKCWGSGAPAGAPEEEESDGGEPGPALLNTNMGYAVLSLLCAHIDATVCVSLLFLSFVKWVFCIVQSFM